MKPRNLDRLDGFIDRPKKAVWVVAAPMMAGFTVHSLYSVVDAVFIGRLGAEAMAAATYISAIFFTVIALTNGLATGIIAAVANACGRRDTEQVHLLASNGLTLGIAISLVFGVLGTLFGPGLIPLLGATGNVADLAWQYMKPLWIGMPLFFVSTSFRSVLNGEGDATTPMVILGIATLLNLCLDPVFIFVLDMGIGGAAYATLSAQGVALLAYLYVVFVKRRTVARFRLGLMVPHRHLMGLIAKIGLPAAAGHGVMALGMVLINRVIAEFGQTAVAGYGAGVKIDMLVALPLLGLAAASVTIVGMFAGAGRPDLVRMVALYTYKWSILASLIIGIGAYLLSEPLIGLFVTDPHALRVGVVYIGYMVFSYPLMSVGMTSGRILQGLGYGMPSLVITTVRVMVFGVAGSYCAVYGIGYGIESIWISMIAGGAAALVLSVFWVRQHLWLRDPSGGRSPVIPVPSSVAPVEIVPLK